MPRSPSLVWHRIANPGPSGLMGSKKLFLEKNLRKEMKVPSAAFFTERYLNNLILMINMKIRILALIILLLFIISCTDNTQKTTPQEITGPLKQEIKETTQKQIEESKQTAEVKEINVEASQWSFNPPTIRVKKGDKIKLVVASKDVSHGFSIPEFNIDLKLKKGETSTAEFTADKTGTFRFYCSVYCGSGHSDMEGTLIVE